MNQKIKRQWLLGIVTALVLLGVGAIARASDDVSVRWDIIHAVLPVLSAGGFASASANDGSVITMTGSGRFQVADGSFDDATGGGTWQIRDASNNLISSGMYRVRGVVLFTQAPGFFPSPPVTGLGAGTNVPFTATAERGGPGTTFVLTISGLTFHETILEGQITF